MQKANQIYEEGLRIVSSSSMFEMHIKFLLEAIAQSNCDVNDENFSVSNPIGECSSHLINVYQNADTAGWLTADVAFEYMELGRNHEAQKLAEKLCDGKLVGSAKLWLLSTALVKVPVSESESLWLLALKFVAHKRTYFDKLVEMSIISVAKGNGSDHRLSPATIIKFMGTLETANGVYWRGRKTLKEVAGFIVPSDLL
ncbi:unnamed protein product [Arabis nemorensis]|uniref:Uncharacterized protein n=1 Tax=Arabis nemorensis TaxID=586526 RepID=A0A565CEP8_9BRAS|nr:unnamed protein product [Arabis nemorensis]